MLYASRYAVYFLSSFFFFFLLFKTIDFAKYSQSPQSLCIHYNNNKGFRQGHREPLLENAAGIYIVSYRTFLIAILAVNMFFFRANRPIDRTTRRRVQLAERKLIIIEHWFFTKVFQQKKGGCAVIADEFSPS